MEELKFLVRIESQFLVGFIDKFYNGLIIDIEKRDYGLRKLLFLEILLLLQNALNYFLRFQQFLLVGDFLVQKSEIIDFDVNPSNGNIVLFALTDDILSILVSKVQIPCMKNIQLYIVVDINTIIGLFSTGNRADVYLGP